MAVKNSYMTNGLKHRMHGNTRCLPHNYSHSLITGVIKFLLNYAEENAILLPGRISGYKYNDLKILPLCWSNICFVN